MKERSRLGYFIVFGNQRTGSTFVASRLNSHPQIVCYEEVFLPWVDREPSLREWLKSTGRPQLLRAVPSVRSRFLAALLDPSGLPDGISSVGFKVMYNQMSLWPRLAYLAPTVGRVFGDPALRNWLRKNDVLIIHTLRKNILKTLISHKLAAWSGQFHSRHTAVGDRRIVIPLLGLKARLRRIEMAEIVARNTIRGLPAIEICYEDYVDSGGSEEDSRICGTLGLPIPAGGLTSPLRKVSSDDLRETVRNYDQVAEYLSGTRFERFLT